MFICCFICYIFFYVTVEDSIDIIKRNSNNVQEFYNCCGFLGWIHVGVFTSLFGALGMLGLVIASFCIKS